METIKTIVGSFSSFLWNGPLIILLVGTHLFLTYRLKFVQKYLGRALKLSVAKDEGAEGDVSQFGALSTALAATIGTGNIIGVSTAIALGGPGAIFWTWIIGFFGIATKYSEALLSIKYRRKNGKGQYVGGPMYALEYGLGKRWLGIAFAAFTVCATFGTGGAIQSKAISGVFFNSFHVPTWIVGLIVTVLTGLVIIGGIRSISKVSEKLVPFMSAFYIIGCIAILVLCSDQILPALKLIITSAFTPRAAGGGFAASTILLASRYGIARGLFSNEAGLGTAPIAAASAITRNPVRQALVSMSSVFWDTLVVCLMTGLSIVAAALKYTDAFQKIGDDEYAQKAFAQLHFLGVQNMGHYVLAIALAIFAFTTILGWAYYGETCFAYIFGDKSRIIYRVLFLAAVMLGCTVDLDLIWRISDIFNGLMAIPNLISLIALSGIIVEETKHYLWNGNMHHSAADKEAHLANLAKQAPSSEE